MSQNTYRVAIALLAGLMLEFIGLTYWQIVRAQDLWDEANNPRIRILEQRTLRGTIFDRRAEPIARSEFAGDRQVRKTVNGTAFAHVVGYMSPRLGRFGIEGKYNTELSGLHQELTFENIRDNFLGKRQKGHDVFLTLDRRLQLAAYHALGNQRGAVVAMMPSTGEVLALVSAPGYNPDRIDQDWPSLTANPAKPLYARAGRGLYAPGSVFKIVTLAANAESGVVPPDAEFNCSGALNIDGYIVHEAEGHAHGQVDLQAAFARSCNIAFAQIAMQLGAERMEDTARRFGLGERIPFDLPVSASFIRRPDLVLSRTILAQTGFGQGQVTVTPLQMAMIGSTIANDGIMMQPMLVKEVRTFEGKTVQRNRHRVMRRVLHSESAHVVLDAMKAVTEEGTAAGIFDQLPFPVAGKTGTAQTPRGRSHAWFVAIAPADSPQIVVAVVVEHGGYGARAAAPVARRVLQEWGTARSG